MHIKYNKYQLLEDMMETSIDEQITQLKAKKKSQNQSNSRAELLRLAGNKNVTDDQLLKVCYSFIGSHRPVGKRKPKVVQ